MYETHGPIVIKYIDWTYLEQDFNKFIIFFIVDITLCLDGRYKKIKKTPWIHSTGNPLPTNYVWRKSTMEKRHIDHYMSASYNSQQEHVISNCVP